MSTFYSVGYQFHFGFVNLAGFTCSVICLGTNVEHCKSVVCFGQMDFGWCLFLPAVQWTANMVYLCYVDLSRFVTVKCLYVYLIVFIGVEMVVRWSVWRMLTLHTLSY